MLSLAFTFSGRIEGAKEQNMEEALSSYREHLSKLLTEESPRFESLVEEYSELWQSNIARFNYINELNSEVNKNCTILHAFY